MKKNLSDSTFKNKPVLLFLSTKGFVPVRCKEVSPKPHSIMY